MDHADFQTLLHQAGLPPLSEATLDRLAAYSDLLVQWNQKVNLTRITQPREIQIKHFIDSLLVARHFPLPGQATLIDVGTGAGFPGIPLKLFQQNLNITLLDSLQKRIIFLKAVGSALDLPFVYLHSRAEDAAKHPEHRERYDIATARAVAPLGVLAEYTLGFVKVGGVLLAMKGADIETELSQAKGSITQMGGSLEEIKSYTLPDDSRRSLVIIRKTNHTPSNFPRTPGKIAKSST